MGRPDVSAKKSKGSKDALAAKSNGVVKPAQTPVAKSKEIAKKAAKVVEKKIKIPSPEPESDSDSSSDSSSDADEESASASEDDSDDSGSESGSGSSSDSDSESEVEEKTIVEKVKKTVANGVIKAADAVKAAVESASESDSSSSSDSDSESGSDEEDEEVMADAPVKKNGINGHAKTAKADSDSSSGSSDSDSDSGSEAEVEAKNAESSEAESGSEDSSESDSDESSSSDDDEEEEVEQPKKRKAEEVPAVTPKKVKVEASAENPPSKTLYVGNLSFNVDEEWLAREFESYSYENLRIVSDRDSGRSKGYGYIDFADEAAATTCFNAMAGTEIDNRALRLDFATPRAPKTDFQSPRERQADRQSKFGDVKSEPSKTMFVGNVSFDSNEDSLYDAFGGAPSGVISVRLITDKETNQPKGYGYIEFGDVESCKAALEGYDGSPIDGRTLRLDYSTGRPNREGGAGGRGGFGGRGGRGGFGGGRGGGFGGDRGGRGGRGGMRGGRGGGRGRGNANSTNRGGFGDFSGSKVTFD